MYVWAAAEYYGVQTHYKYDDEGLISVHIQGNEQELPVFEQMSVINEVDLYKEWVPFCSESCIVDRVTPSELVAYFNINVKLLSRDGCIHAYGTESFLICLMYSQGVFMALLPPRVQGSMHSKSTA